jgi:hypothetical protein
MRGEGCPFEDRLDLAPVRPRDDGDGHPGGRVPHGRTELGCDRRAVCARDVPVDALLDERPQLVALDAQPAADDRLLGVPRERPK